jgi:hypothetical protein
MCTMLSGMQKVRVNVCQIVIKRCTGQELQSRQHVNEKFLTWSKAVLLLNTSSISVSTDLTRINNVILALL